MRRLIMLSTLTLVICTALAPAPSAAPPATQEERPHLEIRTIDASASDTALGVGHLRLADLTFLTEGDWTRHPDSGGGWIHRLELPLYNAPGGLPWSTLTGGRLEPEPAVAPARATGPPALTFTTVATGYGFASLVVHEIRPDGWFRFGPMQPAPLADGSAWARRQDLAAAFVIEPWATVLMARSEPLFFRRDAGHGDRGPALHPNPGGPVVDRIRGSHDLHPLELRGAWMKVRVTRPATACDPDPPRLAPGVEPRTAIGWIRWRDDAGHPRVWFPAKGC